LARSARLRAFTLIGAVLMSAGLASAHDLERTQISITFERDGAFVLDVANDPDWLLLRLEPFAGPVVPRALTSDERDRRLRELAPVFVDRLVLWVDRQEVRPTSAEYVPDRGAYRLRGRLPSGPHTLQWFYGLVIDPYPLTIRYSDGQSQTAVIDGANWSGPLDLTGRFRSRRAELAARYAGLIIIGLPFGYIAWSRRGLWHAVARFRRAAVVASTGRGDAETQRS
jgi:hypothetical protein